MDAAQLHLGLAVATAGAQPLGGATGAGATTPTCPSRRCSATPRILDAVDQHGATQHDGEGKHGEKAPLLAITFLLLPGSSTTLRSEFLIILILLYLPGPASARDLPVLRWERSAWHVAFVGTLALGEEKREVMESEGAPFSWEPRLAVAEVAPRGPISLHLAYTPIRPSTPRHHPPDHADQALLEAEV